MPPACQIWDYFLTGNPNAFALRCSIISLVSHPVLLYGPSMTKKSPHAPSTASIQSITAQLGCSRIIATILVNRGIQSPEAAKRFLNPSLAHLRPPFGVKDMGRAVERIAAAIKKKEQILIFGDYDVDGITSTVLLYEFLRALDAQVSFHIPHRRKEGYGLSESHIVDVAIPAETDLIITADCGSSSYRAVTKAHLEGIDIVVTDHHNITVPPPEAAAVVNPKRHDCAAGFEHLSGVGVVFCLLICLRKHLRDLNFWAHGPEPNLKRLSDIVALGTVADQVPLVKENRILTRVGMDQINTGSRCGIIALMKASGLDRLESSDDIAYRLAPRLNAPGRMEHADIAVRLLTSEDQAVAENLAEDLNRLNTERQRTEQSIMDDIEKCLFKFPALLSGSALVMWDAGWHEGVLGIVAARLVAKYLRPVVLISTKDGIGKGSGRSVPGFDLYEGLKLCESMLQAFGGHAAAAGLKIETDRIDLFATAFEAAVKKLNLPNNLESVYPIDYELNLDQATPDLLDALEMLQPFGQGNPEPVFMARNIRVTSQRVVGIKHRQMHLAQDGSRSIPAIQFNIDPNLPEKDCFETVLFNLRWNRWNGKRKPQIIVRECVGG